MSTGVEIDSLAKFTIPPFYTMEMMKYAAELEATGKTIYHLEVGQSIASTPAPVLAEAVRALRECPLNYCSALGYFPLRQAIAQHYQHAYGVQLEPERVVITPGTSLGLYVALLMNFSKGAKIAIASPSYPCYRNVIQALGYSTVEINTMWDQEYLITPAALQQCREKIDGILIASPNNPTGSMYDEASFKKLSLYCQQAGIRMLSDEIYHGITYDYAAQTALKFDDQALVINGFSKYFAMTGWRVGWIIVPKQDISRYESLLQNIILCTSSLTQIAAIKAFSAYHELDAHVKMYQENREILYRALTEAGLTRIYKPAGGFYIYVELHDVKMNSMDFCKKLLHEEQVAVAPGMDFISQPDQCAIRLSFCQSPSVVEQGAAKLNAFLKRL